MDKNEPLTGYNFEVNGKLVKEHECPICLHLIRSAIELPCTHLMCKECLIYYEDKQLEKNEYAEFCCSLCQEVYQRNQKKEVRSTDRIIHQSLEVKCKDWKDGCAWVGSISNYQNHHINVCDYMIVECTNNGCKEQVQRRAIEKHQGSCQYRIVSCDYCKGKFPICWLEDHHVTCTLYPVPCQNQGCKKLIQRAQMDDHMKNECQYQVVFCLYSEVGCNLQIPRHAMANHQQEAMQHHSNLLLKSHVNLTKKSEDLEKQLKKSNENIEELQKSTIDLSNKNKDLENQLNKSNKTIEQLQQVVLQQKSIERQQADIACLENNVMEQEKLKVKQKLTNLETFAKQTADLFVLVSETKLFSSPMTPILSQKGYDDNDWLKTCKNQLKEIKDKETDCHYLKTLGKAVKFCHEAFFPDTYGERLTIVAEKMIKHSLYPYKQLFHLKTDSCPCKSISFNVYKNGLLFEKELKRNGKWNLHSLFLASYHDHNCYYVAFLYPKLEEVWLLHKSDEDQNKKLQINDKTVIKWDEYAVFAFFTFQINLGS